MECHHCGGDHRIGAAVCSLSSRPRPARDKRQTIKRIGLFGGAVIALLLIGALVQREFTSQRIVFHGDSLTYGVSASWGSSYPEQTIGMLGSGFRARNLGVSAQQMRVMVSNAKNEIDPLITASTRKLCVWGGTNDLAFGGASGQDVYRAIVQYCVDRKAAGWRVVVIGMLPRGGEETSLGFELNRRFVNQQLRNDFTRFTSFPNIRTGAPYADALIDLGSDREIGHAGQERNPTYFSDQIHLTNAGYAIVAQYAKNALSLAPSAPIMSPISKPEAANLR